MKATGVVRKIDDLGRVVIPKEIRKSMHIKQNDPLEIYTDSNGEIVLKKYAPLGDFINLAEIYVEAISEVLEAKICISDKENILAVSEDIKDEYLSKSLSDEVINLMEDRKTFISNNEKNSIPLTFDSFKNNFISQIVIPIICDGDALGTVILFSIDKKFTLIEEKIARISAIFFAKQME